MPPQAPQWASVLPRLKWSLSSCCAGGAAVPATSCAATRSIALRNARKGICARPDIQRKSVFSGTRSTVASACVLASIAAAWRSTFV